MKDESFFKFKPAPVSGGYQDPDYWIWCGSVIKGDDGLYHMFASRWSHSLPFYTGYSYTSEIVRAVSEKPEGPYRFADHVLPVRGSEFWDGKVTHNPAIVPYGDGYALFYIGLTYESEPFSRDSNNELQVTEKCKNSVTTFEIGVATSRSIAGPWKRYDKSILPARDESHWDHSVCTNPSPCILPDGRIILLYRSYGAQIGYAEADNLLGPYRRLDKPVLNFDGRQAVEDTFLWWNGEEFELIAKDLTPEGTLAGEFHAGIHAASPDAKEWRLDKGKAYSRHVLWDDGREITQGCLERPWLLFENNRPAYLFAATADGPGGFNNADKSWNVAIPIE
ncbi:MAG: glycoside hydrolase family protein [Planctomycetota bacterium]|jgi:hypothetical protein